MTEDIKWIDALDELPVAYVAVKLNLDPLIARQVIATAIKDELLSPRLPQTEFIEYVDAVLAARFQPAPPQKKRKITVGSVLGLIVSCILFLLVYGFIKDTAFVPAVPTPQPGPTLPRHTPTVNTPFTTYSRPTIAATPSCLPWSEVTPQMEGSKVCVYGTVSYLREYSGASQIRFGTDSDFFFSSGTIYYPGVKKGACVTATGEVLLSSENVPYIKVDENKIHLCE
jgi:hypothetical protein